MWVLWHLKDQIALLKYKVSLVIAPISPHWHHQVCIWHTRYRGKIVQESTFLFFLLNIYTPLSQAHIHISQGGYHIQSENKRCTGLNNCCADSVKVFKKATKKQNLQWKRQHQKDQKYPNYGFEKFLLADFSKKR